MSELLLFHHAQGLTPGVRAQLLLMTSVGVMTGVALVTTPLINTYSRRRELAAEPASPYTWNSHSE